MMASLRSDEGLVKAKNESQRAKLTGAFARVLSLLSFLRTWRRWSIPAGLLCAAFVLQVSASLSPKLIERYYSRGLYPQIGRGLAFVNKPFSFSIAEVLIFALLAGCGGRAAWLASRLLRHRVERRAVLLKGARGLLWFASCGVLLFLLIWGLNYERQPLFDNLQLPRRSASADELEIISRRIIAGINTNYDEAHAGITPDAIAAPKPVPAAIAGRTRLPMSRAQLYELLEESYQQTSLSVASTGGGFGSPKPVHFSRVLTRLGISGIFFPFTGEANFNAEQPDCDLPFAIAHEMAHQRGFAREDEASFIAFLVCTNSTNPYVRYSGYLNALNVIGVLSRLAPERAPAVYRTLNAAPRADLLARYIFWTNYQGKLSAASSLINNAYLKANRIKSGAKNYNEVSALIIGYYLKKNM